MRNLALLVALAPLALLPACPGGTDDTPAPTPVEPLTPPPEGSGFQLEFVTEAPAGTEVWACKVYDLPTTDVAAVNRVQYQQAPGTHHMTLSTLGLTGDGGVEPGEYDCPELYGDSSLMEDQIMFFGAQGEAEGEMRLPDRVAASFPAGLRIIHEVHFVNTTPDPVELYSRVNAWTIPESAVEEGIWGGSVRDENINLARGETTTEWSRCVMNRDVEVLFLASHMHELGVEFTIAPYDGTTVGDVMYTNDDWHDPKITQYDPPLVIPAGQGFQWSCTWDNTTEGDVTYGLDAEDEMCNLAVVFMPFDVTAACEVVETSDGVLWEP